MKRRRKSKTVGVIVRRRVYYRVGMSVIDRKDPWLAVATIVAIEPEGPVLKRIRFDAEARCMKPECWQAQWENVRPANDGRRYA